jgi:hypothetical protein
VIAVLLSLVSGGWSNGFAISGLILTLGAMGWAIGPFKTPMVWSEGALRAYQPNADAPPSSLPRRRWRVLAVPVFALGAGLILLGVAAVIAAG